MNLNSLINKTNHVNHLLNFHGMHILGISETWLSPSIADSFVELPGYSLVRSDSPVYTRKHGVAIYVHNRFKFIKIDCDLPNILIIFVVDFEIYIITIYRPPSNNYIDNVNLLNFLSNFCLEKEIIILGDFNLPSLNWTLEDVLSVYVAPLDRQFFDLFMSIGLEQVICEPTNFPSCNTLDLILMTHPNRLGSSIVLPPLPHCSHGVILASYIFQFDPMLPEGETEGDSRVWSRGRYDDLMVAALSDLNWYDELYTLNAVDQYRRLLAS